MSITRCEIEFGEEDGPYMQDCESGDYVAYENHKYELAKAVQQARQEVLEHARSAYAAGIKEAKEETRQQCADALDVEEIKRGSHLMEWRRNVILNTGKTSEGEFLSKKDQAEFSDTEYDIGN